LGRGLRADSVAVLMKKLMIWLRTWKMRRALRRVYLAWVRDIMEGRLLPEDAHGFAGLVPRFGDLTLTED